jgi:dTMP kinase
VILPALEAGKIVIADRFFDSTMAYQGYGHGVPLDRIREVTALACGDLVPDRTFLLDMPVDKGLARSGWRAQSKWDRFEVLDAAFHERVREGYRRLAAGEPKRWVVIDADRDERSIAADVQRELHLLLGAAASSR